MTEQHAWQLDKRVPRELKDPDRLAELARPDFYLPNHGHVLDQATDMIIRFRHDICPAVQHSILAYVSSPPRQASGHTKFLALVGARQTTKSATTANCLLSRVQYTPATKAATIADEEARADALFEHVMLTYNNTPKGLRFPTRNTRASRVLNFVHGGSYSTFTSGFRGNTGLGRGIAFTHISEGPFHKDFGGFWNKYYPAVANRKNAAVVVESTPGAMTEPSSAAYRDLMMEAKQGLGRWLYVFAPMWTSILNERPWRPDWRLSNDEIALMTLHGPKDGGPISRPKDVRFLTLENLAFLREVRTMDPKVRRNPELLWVFYPKDDISCWHISGNSTMPGHAMEAMLRRSGGPENLVEWRPQDGCYQEYHPPQAGARYVIGADPAGWGSGDPSSFQVLEVWADAIVQVAEFSSNTVDPHQFAMAIVAAAARYHNAEVFCENNGVGAGTVTILEVEQDKGNLRNLHYYKRGTPGVPMSKPRHEEALGLLIDMALDKAQGGRGVLEIRSHNLHAQLSTYRHDKSVEKSKTAAILVPDEPGAHRRQKHHWDRVSAFLWACYGVQFQPLRDRPRTDLTPSVMPGLHEHTRDFMREYKRLNKKR